ncbi:hypothetical protein BATDEDRAFT_26646 [Batrachochytrium dendrobatidis JAM81]|uniref:Uncharacterized protein n=1 Tax=Batrachochytrium dendrobatidis (strain JAM81 / FGSC 10211) TaxID=684364 RepID=F4P7V6_BATDJ|nr:uncharacterized protein BATDEDRAFT_26646 [Batrachochytrium dendrobatidis JAM81]EGF78729.1 hypothetical protein BATDEDRAFT_26646 [Batrachochytrium dendrobatidis JAM81]|eukprot:XP_006680724.1 hypothetical protein BATDEDRAFT_26646 [Batrachochytrium dendrobatidis JAM81]
MTAKAKCCRFFCPKKPTCPTAYPFTTPLLPRFIRPDKMSYVATLATESCIFSSIVIYGAGVALSNVKSVAGGVTVIVSTVSFLITQILILAVSERLPRAEVVSRQNVWFKAVTYLSTVLGVISIILFIYQFASSPYIPNTCTPNLNKTMFISPGSLQLVWSFFCAGAFGFLSDLAAVVSKCC